MANEFLTPSVIAREALVLLRSNNVMSELVDRGYESNFTGNEKIGDTVQIRKRQTPVVNEWNGSTIDERTIEETSISLKLDKHFDVSQPISTKDLTLEIQDFSTQVLAPIMAAISDQIDAVVAGKFLDVPNVAGNSETAPSTLPVNLAGMALVDKTANDLKFPVAPRYLVGSTEFKSGILSQADFVNANKRGDGGLALRRAEMGEILGFGTYFDQNVDSTTHTSGTATAGTTNGTTSNGALILAVTGMGNAGTIKANDILRIAGYASVVVASDVTLDGSGAGNVVLKYPITKDIATGTAVTLYDHGGNDRQNHGAIFHPNAIALATVPLALPLTGNGETVSFEGFSLRVTLDWDRNRKSDVLSIDILMGSKVVDPRLAAQIVKRV